MITKSRKSALALAGAVAATITAASVAGAVNLGLLSSDPAPASSSQVQLFEPIDATTATTTSTTEAPVQVVVQDVYDLPADNGQAPAPTSTAAPTAPATLTQAPAPSSGGDDGSYTDDGASDDSYEHESDSHDDGGSVSEQPDGEYDD